MTTAMLRDFDFRFDLNPWVRPAVIGLGPRSYFADRIIPQLEVFAIASRDMDGGSAVAQGVAKARTTRDFRGRKEKLRAILSRPTPPQINQSAYHFELRPFFMQNWSHSLNQAIPLAIRVRQHMQDLDLGPPVLLINKGTSKKILRFLDYLGFDSVATNDAVCAPLVTFDSPNRNVIRSFSREFSATITDQIDGMIAKETLPCGKNIFLNRKDTRSLTNNVEIVTLLKARGFDEVFLEDLSFAQQFKALLEAERIVAIHGAALAPILYRQPKHGPYQMIEIQTPGHFVPVYRDITETLPCDYRFIRGIPDPDMSSSGYSDLDPPSLAFTKKHSLRKFALDPETLIAALDDPLDPPFPMGRLYSATKQAEKQS